MIADLRLSGRISASKELIWSSTSWYHFLKLILPKRLGPWSGGASAVRACSFEISVRIEIIWGAISDSLMLSRRNSLMVPSDVLLRGISDLFNWRMNVIISRYARDLWKNWTSGPSCIRFAGESKCWDGSGGEEGRRGRAAMILQPIFFRKTMNPHGYKHWLSNWYTYLSVYFAQYSCATKNPTCKLAENAQPHRCEWHISTSLVQLSTNLFRSLSAPSTCHNTDPYFFVDQLGMIEAS